MASEQIGGKPFAFIQFFIVQDCRFQFPAQEGIDMTHPSIMMIFIAAVFAVGLQATPADAGTTFVGSTVEAVDLSQKTDAGRRT